MKQWWVKQAARIDALSLRERVFIFFSLLACCVALVDVLWLSPAQQSYQQSMQRFRAQDGDLARLRAEFSSAAKPVDASQVVRDDIAAAEQRLLQLQAEIASLAPESAQSGVALEAVLAQFLQRRDGLSLISTGTVKTDTPSAVVAGLNRRGVELKVSGSYAELIRFVKTLELALPRLRWGEMRVQSEKQPPELTLQVFVLEVQP
jgi:MSHA biogenesis protein MshJ